MVKKLNIHNMNDVKESDIGKFDFCVIGSGPAGMVVTCELVSHGFNVCVLESGQMKTSSFADSLRETVTPKMPIKIYSRERAYGGTSITWHGLSAPLDPVEFCERPYIKISGWPIRRNILVKYWRLTSERYGFPEYDLFEPNRWSENILLQSDLHPADKRINGKFFLAAVPPQHFGDKFKTIFELPNAVLYLDSTVIELVHHYSDKQQLEVVYTARVKTSSKKYVNVFARNYILATGGIENARLLLVSKGKDGVSLGNKKDLVGRFFMNHPKNDFGIVKLRRPIRNGAYYFGFMQHNLSGYCGLRISEDYQKKLRVLNSYLRFEPLYPWSDNKGVEAFLTIVKQMKTFMSWWRKRRRGELISLRSYAETGDDTVMQIERKNWLSWLKFGVITLINIRPVLHYVHARLRKGYAPKINYLRVRYFMEMEPREENRITLSNKLDALGVPFPVVDYSVSDLDKKSVVELENILRDVLSKENIGEIKSNIIDEPEWPINLEASHHLGSTRMGTSPENSVVDENLQVHGVSNLFIIGGSVFPMSGCANPTYTACALSIRLADHLKASL